MKPRWIAPAILGACLCAPAVAVAKEDPCQVQVGRVRPSGCAKIRLKRVRRDDDARPKRSLSPPKDPAAHIGKALRKPASERRSRRLLTQELVNTERLLQRMPKNDPDRPRVIRRLAEGYAELEAIAIREKLRAELLAERTERKQRGDQP